MLSSARTTRPASDSPDLLKWGLIRSSSKDRPKPIAAKAREPPQRGGANEGRRKEAGGAREGYEGAGDVSVAPGLIEKARAAVFFSPGSHGELHGRGARCSVEAGGEEARRAFSVARRRLSQDRKASKGRLNAPRAGPLSYQARGCVKQLLV